MRHDEVEFKAGRPGGKRCAPASNGTFAGDVRRLPAPGSGGTSKRGPRGFEPRRYQFSPLLYAGWLGTKTSSAQKQVSHRLQRLEFTEGSWIQARKAQEARGSQLHPADCHFRRIVAGSSFNSGLGHGRNINLLKKSISAAQGRSHQTSVRGIQARMFARVFKLVHHFNCIAGSCRYGRPGGTRCNRTWIKLNAGELVRLEPRPFAATTT
ncbi:hypothetical protein DFH06DRAFT_1119192 [Mycena polygramma]|nr:hypothetical protein DFH06DRAFT_1119192 [Mycena polygramma]